MCRKEAGGTIRRQAWGGNPLGGQSPESSRLTVDSIRNIAQQHNRDLDHIRIPVSINGLTAASDEEARAKRNNHLQYADVEGCLAFFGGSTEVDPSGYSDDENLKLSCFLSPLFENDLELRLEVRICCRLSEELWSTSVWDEIQKVLQLASSSSDHSDCQKIMEVSASGARARLLFNISKLVRTRCQ